MERYRGVVELLIIWDMEVFKYDWIICWLDTETKKTYHIHNDRDRFIKFYEYYKNRIWVGYNSRSYDQWIAKAILCGFDAWEMNQHIIVKEKKGFEFSRVLNKFPIINYDTIVGFKSLKELEAYMGHDIRESGVPWDIDRPLTPKELKSTIQYCKHDVWETFEVFVESKSEFESHIGLIKEFDLPLSYLSKTKAQLSAIILGATQVRRDDEFDITIPDTIDLGRYEFVKEYYYDWAKNDRDYNTMSLETDIAGVPHKFGIGGIHGAKPKYIDTGYFLNADVSSFYPAIMIEYNTLSRNVLHPSKFKQIRDERLVMKANKDPREKPRKIVINGTFGASKDKYNGLYDPLQSNNTCILGQLFITDLIDKLEGKCELVQSNTDGILIKLYDKSDKDEIISICNEWSKRTKFELEFDEISKVIQRDVNNYIVVFENGKIKSKGAVVKKLSRLDNNLPIVNRAVVDFFTKGIPVEETVNKSNSLIDFQLVTKVGGTYTSLWYGVPETNANGKTYPDGCTQIDTRVNRVFASKRHTDGCLYKKHKDKNTIDKVPNVPENAVIINDNIENKTVPEYIDRQWYVDLANDRIKNFV